jgi:hypothetical protein
MILNELIEKYTLREPIVSGDFEIYPIISSLAVSLMSLKEAETLGIAWVQEREVETISTLEAINNGSVGVLIPFLTQVQGGKQDRTVFEPIILPANRTEQNPLPIPTRCLEQGRWCYQDSLDRRTSKRFESSPTRAAGQMAHAFMEDKGQTEVWNQVRAAYAAPGMRMYHSPTVSLVSMSRRVHERSKEMIDLEGSLVEILDLDGQVGIVVTFRGHILGLEIYGGSDLWKYYSKESLRGFLFDRLILGSNIPNKHEGIRLQLVDEFNQFNLKEQQATGDGVLYHIYSDDWQGMCLIENDVPAHLYAVKRQR